MRAFLARMAQIVHVYMVDGVPILYVLKPPGFTINGASIELEDQQKRSKRTRQAYTLDKLGLDWTKEYTFISEDCTRLKAFQHVARHKMRLAGVDPDEPCGECVKHVASRSVRRLWREEGCFAPYSLQRLYRNQARASLADFGGRDGCWFTRRYWMRLTGVSENPPKSAFCISCERRICWCSCPMP